MIEQDFEKEGFLLINKPVNWTSFDVVNKLRYILKVRKIGHAGTLDPLATGLLIICTGKLTKSLETFQSEEKEYTGVMVLGKSTPTYDLESLPDADFPTEHITAEMIQETVPKFLGIIDQFPPIYSAIRKNGERLYELARRGESVELVSRKVEIKSFEIQEINLPEITFKISCSKGTYIRSLAHDFGKALHSGAYLKDLVRTKSGKYDLKDALELTDFIQQYQAFKNKTNL